MTCKDVRLWLSAYLDHELPPRERRHVDEHLTSCAACRRRWDALLVVQMAVRLAGQDVVSEDFDARLGRRSARERLAGWGHRWRPVVMAASAAAAVVLLLLGLVAKREPSPSLVPLTEAHLAIPGSERPCLRCAPPAPLVSDRPCVTRASCGPAVERAP